MKVFKFITINFIFTITTSTSFFITITITIYTYFTCTTASLVGSHYYAAGTVDPWLVTTYTADANGVAEIWTSVEGFGLSDGAARPHPKTRSPRHERPAERISPPSPHHLPAISPPSRRHLPAISPPSPHHLPTASRHLPTISPLPPRHLAAISRRHDERPAERHGAHHRCARRRGR